jgi:6-phosphogluconolactonase (cycloisomerase 2 family)
MRRRLPPVSPDHLAKIPLRQGNSASRPFVVSYLLIVTSLLVGCDAGHNESRTPSAIERARTTAPTAALLQRNAYTVNSTNGAIATYRHIPATGELRRNGYSAAGTDPLSITLSPSGKFAYAANDLSDEVSVFAIDVKTGALTDIGAAVATGTTPKGIAIHPSGKFAYVANFGSNDVSAYAINSTTGALTSLGNAVAAGTNPVSVSVDPDGRSVHVANFNSAALLVYRVDPETGTLTAADGFKSVQGNPFSTTTGSGPGR